MVKELFSLSVLYKLILWPGTFFEVVTFQTFKLLLIAVDIKVALKTMCCHFVDLMADNRK